MTEDRFSEGYDSAVRGVTTCVLDKVGVCSALDAATVAGIAKLMIQLFDKFQCGVKDDMPGWSERVSEARANLAAYEASK